MNSKQRTIVERRIAVIASDAKSRLSKVAGEKTEAAKKKELLSHISPEIRESAKRLLKALEKERKSLISFARKMGERSVNVDNGLLRLDALKSKKEEEKLEVGEDEVNLGIFTVATNYYYKWSEPVKRINEELHEKHKLIDEATDKAIFKLWMETESETAEKMFEDFAKTIAKIV